MKYGNIREEALKNKVAHDFFVVVASQKRRRQYFVESPRLADG
jgi:hypothetical protein